MNGRFRTLSALGASPFLADLGPSDRRFWRALLAGVTGVAAGIVAIIILVVLLMIAGAVILLSQGYDPNDLQRLVAALSDDSLPMNLSMTLAVIAALAVLNGFLSLVVVTIASLVVRKPLKASITAAPTFRWRQLVTGLVLYGLAMIPMVGLMYASGEAKGEIPLLSLTHSAGEIALYVVGAVVGLIVAAGAEELAFRGWLLRHTAAFVRSPWILLLINGVLFSAIHADPDPNAFIARAVMGMIFCYMALRLGGIEFAIGAHAANNIMIVLFIEPMSLKMPAPEAFQAHYLAETAVVLVLGVTVTELVFRVPALRRWTRADAAYPPPHPEPIEEAFR
jgi:uncharacterized protein